MINHDHDKDHDPYESTSCSICFRYPDVHNAVQETKMVSHRKRMKLMFASTKMGWAQHHPATMTDGYWWRLLFLVFWYSRWCSYCPNTLNTQYTTRSQTHKHSKWFLLFFSAQTKPQKHPTFLQNPTRGCIPKAKDWHLKPIPERKFLVPDVRRSCTDDAQLASLTLTPCLDLYSGIKLIRCVACHRRRNWKMSSLLSEMAATCPKTVARINSSQNRVYACAAFAETPWHSVPSFGVVFILGQIHWTLRWYSFSLTKQPKQVLDFEACGLLYSYLSRLWERIVGFNGAFFLLQFHWPRTRPGSIRLAVKKCGPFERAVVPALGPKLGRPNGSLQLYTMEDSHGTYKSSISKGTWSSKPVWLHPRNLTWNLKISPWKRKVLLETIIFRFHVKFRGCMFHVNLQGYTSNSIFTQIFLLKLASKADGFVKISPELMTRNFHGRLGTTLLQVATDWMDQINIWPNAPENHREGRARLGWFCWGFDGGGCLDDSQEYWNQRISFFLWRTPDRSLLHMEKLHLLCVGELVF